MALLTEGLHVRIGHLETGLDVELVPAASRLRGKMRGVCQICLAVSLLQEYLCIFGVRDNVEQML